MPTYAGIRFQPKKGCWRTRASNFRRKKDAGIRGHPISTEKRMLAYAGIQFQPKKGCWRTWASNFRRKKDAGIRGHPISGVKRMLAYAGIQFSTEKRMLIFVSTLFPIRNKLAVCYFCQISHAANACRRSISNPFFTTACCAFPLAINSVSSGLYSKS